MPAARPKRPTGRGARSAARPRRPSDRSASRTDPFEAPRGGPQDPQRKQVEALAHNHLPTRNRPQAGSFEAHAAAYPQGGRLKVSKKLEKQCLAAEDRASDGKAKKRRVPHFLALPFFAAFFAGAASAGAAAFFPLAFAFIAFFMAAMMLLRRRCGRNGKNSE